MTRDDKPSDLVFVPDPWAPNALLGCYVPVPHEETRVSAHSGEPLAGPGPASELRGGERG